MNRPFVPATLLSVVARVDGGPRDRKIVAMVQWKIDMLLQALDAKDFEIRHVEDADGGERTCEPVAAIVPRHAAIPILWAYSHAGFDHGIDLAAACASTLRAPKLFVNESAGDPGDDDDDTKAEMAAAMATLGPDAWNLGDPSSAPGFALVRRSAPWCPDAFLDPHEGLESLIDPSLLRRIERPMKLVTRCDANAPVDPNEREAWSLRPIRQLVSLIDMPDVMATMRTLADLPEEGTRRLDLCTTGRNRT
jgi:hypothetical protein